MFSTGHKLLFFIPFTIGIYFVNFTLVNAQTETPPPPNPGYQTTIQPGYQSGEYDYSCPEGEPLGYGVKTPSPLWMLRCGSCLPENQPIITPTVAYTAEPTALPGNGTSSVTTIAGGRYKEGGFGNYITTFLPEVNYVLAESMQQHENFGLYEDLYLNDSGQNATYQTTFYISYDYQSNATNPPYCMAVANNSWGIQLKYADSVAFEVYKNGALFQFGVLENLDQSITLFQGGGTNSCTSWDFGADWIIELTVYGSGDTTKKDVQMWESNSTYRRTDFNRTIHIGYKQGPYVPEEEPGNSKICESIVGEGEEPEDMAGFEYTGIEFGAISCAVIGPYDFEIFGVGLEMPYIIRLCVQEVGLGEAMIFGVTISLDIFVLGLTIAWAVRSMFNS